MRKFLSATLPAMVAFGFAAGDALAQVGQQRGTPACKILSVEVTPDNKLVIIGSGLTDRRTGRRWFRSVTPRVWFGGTSVAVSSDPAPTSTQIVADASGVVGELTGPKEFLLEIERSRNVDCPSRLVSVVPAQGDTLVAGLSVQGGNDNSMKLVFVTSLSYDGALARDPDGPAEPDTAGCGNGLAGADCICGVHAARAGLQGEYKAWLSDPDASPATRFKRTPVPYVLPDGKTVVAASYADLTRHPLGHAINQTETAEELASASDVWTNTDVNGKIVNEEHSCRSDWSDTSIESVGGIGSSGDTAATWTQIPYPLATMDCGLMYARLYCFQQ